MGRCGSILNFSAAILLIFANTHKGAAVPHKVSLNSTTRECGGVKTVSNARGTDPGIATWTKSADGFVRIPYTIEPSLSAAAIPVIEFASYLYKRFTCISLEPKKSTDFTNYVKFQDDPEDSGCWSYLGRINRPQEINLSNGCYNKIGTVLHEIGHALGIHHEQERPDRDNYVTINFANIETEHVHNFEKVDEIDSLGTPYDFLSMMHYSSYAFALPGTKTIIKKDGSDISGQRNGFSAIDVEQINKLYECNGVKVDYGEATTCYHAIDKGLSYRGRANSIIFNDGTEIACDPWNTLVNEADYYLHDLKDNHCRNIDPLTYDKPMCYLTIGGTLYYNYCNVPACSTLWTTADPGPTTTPWTFAWLTHTTDETTADPRPTTTPWTFAWLTHTTTTDESNPLVPCRPITYLGFIQVGCGTLGNLPTIWIYVVVMVFFLL